jgi:hypothetical protein
LFDDLSLIQATNIDGPVKSVRFKGAHTANRDPNGHDDRGLRRDTALTGIRRNPDVNTAEPGLSAAASTSI